MSLLILTSDKDLTADFLISDLLTKALPYFRLNSEDLAAADCRYEIGDGGVTREISVGPRRLDFSDVTAVWYRRAIHPMPVGGMAPAERNFAAGEMRHLFAGMALDPSITWVNPIDRVSIAEHKLYQLRLAHSLGFEIPRTLVSSDNAALRDFVTKAPSGAICKPLYHGLFIDGSARYSVYTRRVRADEFDGDSPQPCPVLLQEEVPRRSDIRVTFVGDKCFVADVTGRQGLIDWRDPEENVRYSVSTIAERDEFLCRSMLGRLGLLYGAFDFIRTPDGRLVFLEVNPTGEWAWLEDRLGFPMRDAFVDIFFGSR